MGVLIIKRKKRKKEKKRRGVLFFIKQKYIVAVMAAYDVPNLVTFGLAYIKLNIWDTAYKYCNML